MVVTAGKGFVADIQGNEARNADQHPTSSHMCPFPKNHMAHHVNSAEAEKCYLIKAKTHRLSDMGKASVSSNSLS